MEKRQDRTQSFSNAIGNVLWIIQRPDSRKRWEYVRSQISALATEATIATFLASVQGTILSLSVNSVSTSVTLTAAKALAFLGILLDVISAFLALLSSTLLQAKISEVQRLLDGINHMSLDDLTRLQDDFNHSDPTDPFRKFLVDTPLWESLKLEVLTRIMARLEELKKQSADQFVGADPTSILSSAQTPPQRSGSRRHHDTPSDLDRSLAPASSKSMPSTLDSELEKVRYQISQINSRVEGLLVDIRNSVPEVPMIQQACQRIENIGSVGDSAGTAILLGGLAFLSSSVCLAASTQPREVWIPTVVACGSVLYLPGVNMLLKYFNIRLPSVFDTI